MTTGLSFNVDAKFESLIMYKSPERRLYIMKRIFMWHCEKQCFGAFAFANKVNVMPSF